MYKYFYDLVICVSGGFNIVCWVDLFWFIFLVFECVWGCICEVGIGFNKIFGVDDLFLCLGDCCFFCILW